jgi:hypothetical protein
VIIERLVRAAERGVKLHVMARPPHTLKKDKLIEGVGGLRILHDRIDLFRMGIQLLYQFSGSHIPDRYPPITMPHRYARSF